ncbi:TnsD family transposase [Vibrio parahaemolyticus]|uniref:TnsD family Tn7-like transposition protein n=1 Tax=Vibrio parahaemolyticus TaxID=670 RepID=UPI00226A1D95|nr:TnsD family Tn7-like transposition protein [Vibrio parahaemolyticus]MCX8810999.1 TnsD family transposase [Vibrio parahaemolyticus]MCX8835970.1 TnsD family transposase [Vibrio parahaemolyticus]MCX8908000.1 TnsD family transposase [Vibrio parahaemolyticus]HCE2830858.1 TniQ family protein [Vibrio parahaemolyticus]HCH0818477.1 TniQ family protein [Vibrio parahaemolyticus]
MRLPQPLPDESFHSRICRHIALCGSTTEQYLKGVFGDNRASVHPYLNANLDSICKALNQSTPDVWLNQTLAPLFSHFLPKYRQVIGDIKVSPNSLIRASQISAFREKERLHIKYCPNCAEEEVRKYGVPYWHCLHQITGVDACPRHGIWLSHVELPDRSHIDMPSIVFIQPIDCSPMAAKFADYCGGYLHQIRKNERKLSNENRIERLRKKGFITNSGQIRRKQICEELFVLSEKILPSDSALKPKSSQDFSYWSPVLSGAMNQLPFKQLILDFYLEQIADDEKPSHVSAPKVDNANSLVEERCCDLLRKGCSMAEVSRQVGKSRCYVKGIALKHQILVNLRPKVITKALKQDVIDMACKGFHRQAIARKHQVSTGSIELIISTTDGLVEWRKLCKHQSMSRRYKAQITRFLLSRPQATIQNVKTDCEAAFFWLYNHQKGWLDCSLPAPQKVQHVDRVDWKQRDKELSKQVVQILSSSDHKLSRTQLDRILGGHGWLTSRKEKLPKILGIIDAYKSK